MKNLVSVNTNIIYKKSGEEYDKYFEIVLLIDQAQYNRTNAGEIIRERGIEEQRFVTSEKGLDGLIEILTKYKEAKEEDLH